MVIFVYTWPAFISFLIASRSVPTFSVLDALKLVLSVSLVGFGVYFYNDILDLTDDLKNREMGNPTLASRPLGRGMITEGKLQKFVWLSAIAGLLLAYTINLSVFVLQLAYAILGVLYSTEPIRLKKRFLMKQGTIAIGCVLANLSGAMAIGVFNPPILYMLALNVMICMGLNPLLDIRDMRGDRIMGVKSIPLVWGPELTVRLYFVSLVAIGAATVVGYSQMGFNLAMPILATIVLGAWFYVAYPLLRRWDDPVFVNMIIYKKTFPLYLILQLIPLIGVMNIFAP